MLDKDAISGISSIATCHIGHKHKSTQISRYKPF
nr:MAG TPA: hypothetical protein [Caudoviricetes sp.]